MAQIINFSKAANFAISYTIRPDDENGEGVEILFEPDGLVIEYLEDRRYRRLHLSYEEMGRIFSAAQEVLELGEAEDVQA